MNLLKYREVADWLRISKQTARLLGTTGQNLEICLGPRAHRVTEESVRQYLVANMGPRRQQAAA